jgi:hypothetical protein
MISLSELSFSNRALSNFNFPEFKENWIFDKNIKEAKTQRTRFFRYERIWIVTRNVVSDSNRI